MKRWNGWGSEEMDYHAPDAALAFLAERLGTLRPAASIEFAQAAARVPASRLPAHPGVSQDAVQRLRHARGHSLPDWTALRFGEIETFPDGVAYPNTEEEVTALLAWAQEVGANVIPYGGGTSVVGHINPLAGDRPVLTLDMSRMFRLMDLDETSRLATFAAGVTGPHLEAQLRAHGYILGHFPQSFEFSTLGGWVATRSSGQQSLRYGRIEELFAGGRLLSPAGVLDLPPLPASAAGPDLRHLALGSEGRLGVITQATVRISKLPDREEFHAVFFPDWEEGFTAVREIVQAGVGVSMLRLSDPIETVTTLILAGRARLIHLAEQLLRRRGVGEGKCMLLLGATGSEAEVRQARAAALKIARKYRGVATGRIMGNEWRKSRFRTPYLRNTLWEQGLAIDTLETALPWRVAPAAHGAIAQALHAALAEVGERVHVFAHLSHVYPTGVSIYTTYLFRIAPTAAETIVRWRRLKTAASATIVAHGGTISHQHGVGVDHLSWLPAEKGTLGMQALTDLAHTFDPAGIMNPGKLVGE